MASERFNFLAAVYLLLIKDDKVLLIRRYNTGWEDGKYTLPAGHIDGEESVKVATAREANEEIGITINPDDLKVFHVMHRKSQMEYFDFFLTTDKWEGEIVNNEPEKCDEVGWYEISSLPSDLLPYVKKAVGYYKNNISFSEEGF